MTSVEVRSRELGHGGRLNDGLRNEGIQRRVFGFQRFAAKRLDVEAEGALHIAQGLLERAPLSRHDTLNARRITDVALGVLLDDDLHPAKLP